MTTVKPTSFLNNNHNEPANLPGDGGGPATLPDDIHPTTIPDVDYGRSIPF
jgi:hypothetical protein